MDTKMSKLMTLDIEKLKVGISSPYSPHAKIFPISRERYLTFQNTKQIQVHYNSATICQSGGGLHICNKYK